MTLHNALTGVELHEPKGTAAANAGEVFTANGAGSGAYGKVAETSIDSTGEDRGRILVATGGDSVGWQELIWKDLKGLVIPKASGAGSPTRTTYIGNISDYAFTVNDIVDLNYHIPHDYAPGTDIFLHIHWSHNGTNISGTLEVTAYVTAAKGHDQGTFPTEIAPTITRGSLSIGVESTRLHLLDEIQLTAASPSATQFNTNILEPDTVIIISLKVTTLPTVTAGSLFIHEVDLHYQSSYIGTANNVPNFYV